MHPDDGLAPAPVTLALLGTPRVQSDANAAPPRFRSRKALYLLSYLAAERAAQSRDWVAELLWPTLPVLNRRAELARVLHDLKTGLGPVLWADRRQVGLVPDRVTVDVWLLSAASVAADPPGWEAAVDLYRGPFLDGVEADEPDFSAWVERQRRRLSSVHVGLLERLTSTAVAAGEMDAGLRWASLWHAHDLFDEEAARRLGWLLARTGRPVAALAHLDQLRTRLREELRIEASTSTLVLARDIRAGRIPTVRSALPLPPLPASWAPLIGRDQLVDELASRLSGSGIRILTLVGAGGIGKTRVALAVAQQLRADSAFGAVGFVDLTAVRSPRLLEETVARQLGLVIGPDPSVSLRQQIGRTRTLLVLDNVEQIPDVGRVLLGLLSALPQLHLLVTSRGPVRLMGEQLVDVPPLDADAASALFHERAAAGGASLSTVEDAGTVDELCAVLGGLPLALELSAISVRPLGLAEVSLRSRNGASPGVGQEVDRPDRHRTIRQAVEWSHELLELPARALFADLSAFASSVTPARVAGLDGRDLEIARAQLLQLSDAGLLQLRYADGLSERYRLLPPIAAVAAEKAAWSGRRSAAEQAHSHLYRRLVRASRDRGTDAAGQDQVTRILALEDEVEEVRLALERVHQRFPAELAAWWLDLRHFWILCGHAQEAGEWVDRALTQQDALDPLTVGRLLLLGQHAAHESDALERVQRFAEQMEPLAPADPTGELYAEHLAGLASRALYEGRVAESLAWSEQAVVAVREHGLLLSELSQQALLSFTADMLGRPEQATAAAVQGLRRSVETEDVMWRSSLLTVVGRRALVAGQLAAAAELYAQAAELSVRTRHVFMIRPSLLGAAQSAHLLGRHDLAAELLGTVQSLDEDIGSVLGTWVVMREGLNQQLPRSLGTDSFAQAVSRGRSLSLAHAARAARSVVPPNGPAAAAAFCA